MEETKGFVHSIESMGLVDGPGIRVVVFLQGCRLRCQFCHNPDTWKGQGGTSMTPSELLQKIERFRAYFARSGGGVTFSGGEPLMQPDFLLACLKLCRKEGIVPALESSHALAYALKMIRAEPDKEQIVVVNLSGRGDKDLETVMKIFKL